MIGWEYVALGLIVTGLAIFGMIMSRKTRATVTIVQGGVDVKALAEETAKAVGKEIAASLAETLKEIVANMPAGAQVEHHRVGDISRTTISMDESIIPIKVHTQKIEANLEGMAKEEVTIDKGIKKSQSKLKEVLGRKKKKE